MKNKITKISFALIWMVLICTSTFGQMYTNGRYIYTQNNEKVVLRGVNEMFVWSSDPAGSWIMPEIAKTGANSVRIATQDDYSATNLRNAIVNARNNGMIAMPAIWHATGKWSELQRCVNYWLRSDVKSAIQDNEQFVLLNIANEAGDWSVTHQQFVDGYKSAITQLRNAGYKCPLVIDASGWGWDYNRLFGAWQELNNHDPRKAIIPSVHTYWNTNHQAKYDECINWAKNNNAPLIFGEGPTPTGYDCNPSSYEYALQQCQSNEIGWLAWSWGAVRNSDCSSVNAYNMTTNGYYGSWGSTANRNIAVDSPYSIKNTSIRPPSLGGTTVAVTGVTVSPTSASVAVNATTQLTATVSPSNATNKNVSWSSSNTGIATVSASGLVTGKATGSATITVTTQDGNKTATCAVTVTGLTAVPVPAKIEAEDWTAMSGVQTENTTDTGGGLNVGYIDQGDWMDYYINVPSAGTYTIDLRLASPNSGRQLQLRVGSTTLATVNVPQTGGWQNWQTVSASVSLSSGNQTLRILASSGSGWNINWFEVKGSSTVAVTGVTVSPTSASINVGATQQLTATVSPSNATNKNVSWSSSNTSIATVNSSGLVTGMAAGSATITVTTQDGGKTATSAITVTSSPPSGYTIHEAENAVLTGVSVASSLSGYSGTGYIEGRTLDNTSDKITWTVNRSTAGSYEIIMRYYGEFGNKTNDLWINGVLRQQTAYAATSAWTEKSLGTFSLNSGNNTIELRSNWGWMHVDYLKVGGGGSDPIAVTGVTVSPTSASVNVGATQQLTATVSPSDATNKNVSWSSSNTSIATVNSSGLVTGMAAGSATITVTTQDGGKTATSAITVTTSTVAVTGVSVSPTSASINVGATQQLTATVSPSNATNKNVSWSSSNTSVTTVSSSGLVTGVAGGSATITVTTQDGGKTATSAITVTTSTGVAVPAKIEAENWTAMSGVQTQTTTDTGGGLNVGWIDQGDWMDYFINVPSAGTYTIDLRLASQNSGRQLQLRVGSTTLATVNVPNTGGWQNWQTVSTSVSLSSGDQTLRILASSGSGWNINWFEVKSSSTVAVTGVTVSPTSASIDVGATQQLTATVSPSNATNKNVSWNSNNTSVATVSSSGLVTGVAAGSATITVTTQDGNKTATSAITVSAPPSGDNLLLNPGWELGTQNWSLQSPWSVSSADKRTGSYSLRLAGTKSWANAYQNVAVTANTNYNVSFYIKGSGCTRLDIVNTGWGQIASKTATPTGSWSQETLSFNSGSNSNIIVVFKDACSGTLYIDDAELVAVSGLKMAFVDQSLADQSLTGQTELASMSIYPNPSDGNYLWIKLNGIADERINISIYSINGSLVYNDIKYNQDIIEIEPGLSKGVYLIRVNDLLQTIVIH
jgi:uncharacterized protein YjdB